MIKKLWVKFDDMNVVCVCNEHDRECRAKRCKEYVVKFTEIQRKKETPRVDKEELLVRNAIRKLKRSETELSKSINKLGKLRIR